MAGSTSSSSQLANRYASALLALADDKKAVDKVSLDLQGLETLLGESQDLADLIASPVLGRDVQGKAMAEILKKAKANTISKNFIAVLVENGRLSILGSVIKAFQDALSRRMGEVKAEVISARILTKGQTEDLAKQLKSVVGADVNISASVDPSILGGLIVKVGSRMLDSSLKTKLANLQLALSKAEMSA